MSKTSKDAAALNTVFQYLLKQNRPYSAIDVTQNLGKEPGKAAVVKALESLTAEGKVREKVYGKQKVYCVDQSLLPAVDEAGIKEMDDRIAQLSGRLDLKSSEVRKLESELRSFESMVSTADAQAQLEEIEPEIERLSEKLNKLKKGTLLISKSEKENVYKGREKFVKEWRKRKRISSDILNAILEGYPKTKKQLYEDIGIETDEEYNVKPPDI